MAISEWEYAYSRLCAWIKSKEQDRGDTTEIFLKDLRTILESPLTMKAVGEQIAHRVVELINKERAEHTERILQSIWEQPLPSERYRAVMDEFEARLWEARKKRGRWWQFWRRV